jgi:hypothetical protein
MGRLKLSEIFRRSPDAAFDLPRRLAGGQDLPVTLRVDGLDKHPIMIESVKVTVSRPLSQQRPTPQPPKLFEFDGKTVESSETDHPLKGQIKEYRLIIPRSELPCGEVFVNACLWYRRIKKGAAGKSVRAVLNDSRAAAAKGSFQCAITGGGE